MMLDVKDQIWEKQIGKGRIVGEDFSGREIHYDAYHNYSSPFGWTLLSFGGDEYLITHIKTEEEFPKTFTGSEDEEFEVNGKTFNIRKNISGEWDINLVEYDEEYIPATQVSYKPEPVTNLNNSMYNNQQQIVPPVDATQSFSFNNYSSSSTPIVENPVTSATIKNQQKQIEELQKQIAYEQTQQYEIQQNNKKLNDLKNELARTQSINISSVNNVPFSFGRTQSIPVPPVVNQFNTGFVPFSPSLQQPTTIDPVNQFHTQSINAINNVPNNNVQSVAPSINKNLISNLTKKLDEQTMQIKSLRIEQKNNARKLDDIEKKKANKLKQQKNMQNQEGMIEDSQNNLKTSLLNEEKLIKALEEERQKDAKLAEEKVKKAIADENLKRAQGVWEASFGSNSLATDFAGRVIIKEKFEEDVEGGWNLDFYNKQKSSDQYPASVQTIKERNGQLNFSINGKGYIVNNVDGVWKIETIEKGQNVQYSSKNMTSIASNYAPDDNKEFNGNYESYSSLLINLNHFPLIHLEKFEDFLKQTLQPLSFFKELFIYSNERLYRKDESNISAYARVFFKTGSTKEDIEILLASLSLKKAMMKFTSNFKQTNLRDQISFSMVLMSHQRTLKFVHAQTNFELLRKHPIPLKVPLERLILDKEYNSILKFHENNLWKQLKPFALDWNGNTYYVCDIDVEHMDLSVLNKNNN